MNASEDRGWVAWAVRQINADYARSADTHLIRFDLPVLAAADINLYFKDESSHPSGSLKHRLARSLFLYGLCNGRIVEGTTIVEASSGSTAISEAYFARLIGLPFVAVIPASTAAAKIRQIEFFGGRCVKVDGKDIYGRAEALAAELGGHYVDQFTFAERATDWRGNNNIADSLFSQLALERFPVPSWIVVSAGTGGTSATIGRYIRYVPDLCDQVKLCVVDPERSVFFDSFIGREPAAAAGGSRIEGIGRPRVEPSFLPEVIDEMIKVPDAASIAAIHWLEQRLGRKCGGSTGTNLIGALLKVSEMAKAGESGSVVTLICDAGERYLESYYSEDWVSREGLDLAPYLAGLAAFEQTGELCLPGILSGNPHGVS